MKKFIFLIIGVLLLSGCSLADRVYEEPTDTQERAKVVFAGDGFDVSGKISLTDDYLFFYIETTKNSLARFYVGPSTAEIPNNGNNFNIPIPSKLGIYSQVYLLANETAYFRFSCHFKDPDRMKSGAKDNSFAKVFTGVHFTPEPDGQYLVVVENLMKDGFKATGNDCRIGISKVTGTQSNPVYTPVKFKIENAYRYN